jgi:DNA polymerase-3 subunit epsilon
LATKVPQNPEKFNYSDRFAVSADPLDHLKNRLFALTSRGALLRVAGTLGLPEMEQRHTYAIINALREKVSFDLGLVLSQLSEIELKMLAGDLGFRLATRDERTAALLAYAAGAALPSALPPPGPAALPSSSAVAAPPPSAALPSSPSAVLPPSPSAVAVAAAAPSRPAVVVPSRPAASSGAGLAPSPVLPAVMALDEGFALAPPSSRGARSKRGPSRLPGAAGEPFVAIDFETADYGRDSACAVALVRVEEDQIVRRVAWLIRPPRREMVHTGVHGITWAMVANQPTFKEIWPRLSPLLEGAAYLVAHNAPFDRSVLRACCGAAGLAEPAQDFECTVQMARRLWAVPQANLPFLCQRFGIPLKHHDAASDAEACARLVLVARGQQKNPTAGR